jgi:hypothetical protein
MHRSSHTIKSKKIQICAGNIHHHKPMSKTSLEFRLRCVPYSTKYYRFILCYIARSGVLLLFVSILTSIVQLQSNKFEQRGLEIILTDPDSFRIATSSLPSVLLKMNLTWSLKTSYFPIPHTNFTKHGSPKSMTSIKLLHCAKSSLTKVYGFGTLNLVTIVWKISFTIFLEHLPPQLEIAGLLQSSTPSCKYSQVNLTWLKFFILPVSITCIWHSWVSIYRTKTWGLLPHMVSLHHITSSYYNFRGLKFNKLPLIYFFQ